MLVLTMQKETIFYIQNKKTNEVLILLQSEKDCHQTKIVFADNSQYYFITRDPSHLQTPNNLRKRSCHNPKCCKVYYHRPTSNFCSPTCEENFLKGTSYE